MCHTELVTGEPSLSLETIATSSLDREARTVFVALEVRVDVHEGKAMSVLPAAS